MEKIRESKTLGIQTMEENKNVESRPYIFGWENDMKVAETVWGSIHNDLLNGNLVFAYRSSTQGSKLGQIVIVRNIDFNTGKPLDTFGVGYITSGYSALLPHVPLEYLKEEIASYLEDWKIDKNILGTYRAIIEDLEREEK